MKIAVFTDNFFPGWGGTECAVYNLCKGLIALGHQILLFAPDYHKEQSFDEFEVVRLKSIRFVKSEMYAVPGRNYRMVFEKIACFDPDIIYHCSAVSMATIAVKTAKKFKKPLVVTVHTKFKEAFYDGSHSKTITACMIRSFVSKLKESDKVVTVCDDMKRELFAYGYKGDVTVIKNGIDHLEQVECAEEYAKTDDCFTFLFCGRLVKIKNIQFSIRSLGLLKREKGFDKFKFLLVGGGKYEKALRKLVKRENLEENVIFLGYIADKKDLAKIYKQSDLFLFPSTFDNDSLVICEAAAQGTPTLTLKDCGSSERIRDNENGFLSDRNERAFAERMVEIMTDGQLREHVCNNLNAPWGDTWLTVARQYEELFQSLL